MHLLGVLRILSARLVVRGTHVHSVSLASVAHGDMGSLASVAHGDMGSLASVAHGGRRRAERRRG